MGFFPGSPNGIFSAGAHQVLSLKTSRNYNHLTSAAIHDCTFARMYLYVQHGMLQYVFASECRQAVFKIIQVMIHPIQYILDLDPYKLILELNIDSSRVIQRILKKTKSLKKPSNKT